MNTQHRHIKRSFSLQRLLSFTCLGLASFLCACGADFSAGGGGTYQKFGEAMSDIKLALDSAEQLTVGSHVMEFQDSDFSASSSDDAVVTVRPLAREEIFGEADPSAVYFTLTGVSEGSATITLTYSGEQEEQSSFEVTVQPSVQVKYELVSTTLVEGSRAWASARHYNAEDEWLAGSITFESLDLEGLTLSQSAPNQVELYATRAGEYTVTLNGEQSIKVVALSDLSDLAIWNLDEERIEADSEAELSVPVNQEYYFALELKAEEWFFAPEFSVEEGASATLSAVVAEGSAEVCSVTRIESEQFYWLKPYNWGVRGLTTGTCEVTFRVGEVSRTFIFTVTEEPTGSVPPEETTESTTEGE